MKKPAREKVTVRRHEKKFWIRMTSGITDITFVLDTEPDKTPDSVRDDHGKFESSLVPGMIYNQYQRTVAWGDRVLDVRPKIMQILLFLESQSGSATTDRIKENCWNPDSPPSRKSLDQVLRKLDELLGSLACGFHLERDGKEAIMKKIAVN